MTSNTAETAIEHPSNRLPAEKRAVLFRLAVEEFSAQGFRHASLNRIIAGAGMSKSSFYNYFENKADLFHRTIDNSLAPLHAEFEAFDFEALDVDTFWPALQEIVRGQTLSATRSPEMELIARMVFRAMEDAEERELTRKPVAASTEWLVGLIRRGQALGLVRRDLPEDLLVTTVMGYSTAFDRWVFEHWEGLAEHEVLVLAGAAVDAYKRLLQPGSDPGTTAGDRR